MSHCSRRHFLKAGVAAVPFVGAASLQIKGATATATDWVTLGRSDVKVTRLAFGTGTSSGKVQRDLGQEEAVQLLVNGFVREVLQELPMEFAVEAQKLVAISLEGSVG